MVITARVDLDTGLPAFDFSGGHSQVRVSDRAGGYAEHTLAHTNPQPLFLPADSLAQDGLLINRASLNSAQVPYFAFRANDPQAAGVGSQAASMTAQVRYEKNGGVVGAWRNVSVVAGEFLLPLLTEFLHEQWLLSTPDDVHQLRVRINDEAGNSRDQVFEFRTDFVAPVLAVNGGLSVYAYQNIERLTFSSRAQLMQGAAVDVFGYKFTNNSDHAVYIQASDDFQSSVLRSAEQKVRENRVRYTVEEQWWVKWILNPKDYCPSAADALAVAAFEVQKGDVGHFYNFTGSAWERIEQPLPVYGEEESLGYDTPALPDVGWVDMVFPDDVHAEFVDVRNGATHTFKYDYLRFLPAYGDDYGTPILVQDRQIVFPDRIRTCSDLLYFKKRTVEGYQSLEGYPRTNTTLLEEAETLEEQFVVWDVDTAEWLTAFNGWVRVPASHTVEVTKQVIGPSFAPYVDTEVVGPDFSSYAPKTYDSALRWTLNSGISLNIVHDAGIDNIFAMTPTRMLLNTHELVYTLSR